MGAKLTGAVCRPDTCIVHLKEGVAQNDKGENCEGTCEINYCFL